MESVSSPALLTEEDLGSLLTPVQYLDLLRNTLLGESFLGSHVKVHDRLSATEERDCLLSRQDQSIRGISSVARAGCNRRKTNDEDGTGSSHGGQLTFRPAEDPSIATTSFDFKASNVQVLIW